MIIALKVKDKFGFINGKCKVSNSDMQAMKNGRKWIIW